MRHCRLKGHPFTTHQLKQERAFRCVIEGLHNSTNTSYVISELQKYGHKVRSIICARHRIEKYPIDLFFVDLEPETNNAKVYDVIYIGNAKVKIVPPRESPQGWKPQCYRCQDLGHTRTYCNKPWVCVKCGGNHPTTTCKKPKDAPAKCCFCNGPHPSNYRGCAELKRRMGHQERTATQQRGPEQQFNYHPSQFPNFGGERQSADRGFNTNQSASYANVAAQNTQIETRMLEMMMRMEVALNKQLEMMNNVINMITLCINQCRN